jgi:hypothetical protein
MKKTIARIIDILMILLVVAILGTACKSPEKMTGKEYSQYQNSKFKKFDAYKKPRK